MTAANHTAMDIALTTPIPRTLRTGLWRLADPDVVLTSLCALLLGCAAAAKQVSISPVAVAISVVCLAALELCRNAYSIHLSRHGWSEFAFRALCIPGICVAAYVAQTGWMTPRMALLSIPMGLLAAGYLWASEFSGHGSGGWFIRVGREQAGQILELLVACAFLALALLPTFGAPQGVWFGVAALPFAAGGAHKLADQLETPDGLVAARQMMLQGVVVFAVAMSAGLMF